MQSARVLTVSDGVAAGEREDLSGPALCERLRAAGFDVAEPAVIIRDFRSDMSYQAISDDKLRADAEVLPGLPSGAAGEKDHKGKRPRSEEGQESSAETAAVSRLSSTTPATMTMPKKTKDDQSQSRLKSPGAGGKSEKK